MRRVVAVLLLCCLMAAPALADNRTYYEIFPASFYDASGDGVGDLRGIQQKLDYLQDLGVEGLWLMPIHPSPSYHKYDAMDYYGVDPAYGTVEDLEALAGAMRARSMTLLLDLVLNHTSSRHPWFLSAAQSLAVAPCGAERCADSPRCRAHNPFVGYYHFVDQPTPGWHAVPGAAGWYYEGGFSPDMPDLNLDNEALRGEILAICAYWMDKGVGGFRLDAVAHLFGEDIERNNAFLRWLMEALRAINPEVYVVGEAWKDAATIARYYESGLPSLFNFPFSGAEGALASAVRSGKGSALARRAADWQTVWSGFAGASDAPFLSNHDNARIAGALARDEEKLKLAASLYLMLPGTPFLYYGEEIGMTGSGRDENKRLPMVWSETGGAGACLPPPGADQTAKTLGSVEALLAREDSLLAHYRELLALRKAHSALRGGTLTPIDTGEDALCAYRLEDEAEALLIAHNLGGDAVQLTWDGETHEIMPLKTLLLTLQ